MTLTLDKFKEPKQDKLSLSSFEGSNPLGMKIGTKAASMIASTKALMGPPDVDQFRSTRQMLLDPSARGQFIVEQTALREQLFQQAADDMPAFAMDESIPVEDRIQLVEGANAGLQSPFSRTPNLDMLGEESLIMDSSGETEQESDFRYNFSGSIQRSNEQKRRISNAINSLRLREDQTVGETIVDVAELFAPLAEWVHIDNLVRDAQQTIGEGGTDFFALMGTQKQELFDMARSMPVNEREEFSNALLDIITEHGNIVFPDGNDLMTADLLEKSLLDGSYNNFELWFDNVTSLLDVVMVGGMIRRSVKGTGALIDTGKAAQSTIHDGSIVSREGLDVGATPSEVVLRDVESTAVDDVYDLDPSVWSESTTTPPVTTNDLQRIARSEATGTDVVPTSPSQVVKDTNPSMARNMSEVSLADETGEAAEALYGADRTEAAAKDFLPEANVTPGRTPNKVEMEPSPVYQEPKHIREARQNEGNTAVSKSELDTAYAGVFRDMELKTSSMALRSLDDGSLQVGARYSPPDAAFTTVDEAINSAQFAFRNYGLAPEDLNILVRDGSTWKKVSREEAVNLPEGTSYSVGIDYNYRFRPEDLGDVDLLSTGNMVTRTLDSIPTQTLARMGQGSVVQNLLDAASTIHPQIVNAASVSVDKTYALKSMYTDLVNDFTKVYSRMPKERRAVMTDYINKANFEGIKFGVSDLAARGFSGKEIEALKTWRRANDAMWHAANEDLVRTLRGKGYVSFQHKANGTTLIGRPVTKGVIGRGDYLYDAANSKNIKPDNSFLDDLYEQGGEVIRLDEPVKIDSEWVEFALSRNTPEGGYTRALYDTETVLNYRDGYYPVMYDANYFITKTVTNPGGKQFEKVVGTAKTRSEVDEALQRMRTLDSGSDYTFKKDRRFGEKSSTEVGDQGWNMAVNSGLTNQRVRGKQLEDMSAGIQKGINSNLRDPLEAMANQINKLSQRIPMRQYLDTVKNRWMQNYGRHLNLPVNSKTGKKEFPSSVGALTNKDNPEVKSSFLADARTNYNYLYSLENGYINGMDEGYKGAMHMLSDKLGEMGIAKGETALRAAAEVSPTQAGKTAAFKMFLSLNPMRQAIVQRGQMIMLGAVNPKYVANGMIQDLWRIDLARAGAKATPETQRLLKELESTGILQAVDSHNFIRQDQLRLADMTNMQKLSGTAMTPVNYLQKVGFDFAEQDNLLAAWLAHRDMAVKAGRNLDDQRVREEVLGQTRAFTLNMNRAGDQPYAQNTLAIAAQFLSFPHKALIQGVTNKSLPPMKRAQLLAYTASVFGVGATAIGPAVDWAFEGTEPGPLKDTINDGLMDVFLNKALSFAGEGKTAINWGDLAPSEVYGMGEALMGLFSTDLTEVVSASPAGSLLFGANPRVTNLMSTAARYFNVTDDYDDPELKTTFGDVSTAFMSLSSGYSNFFKARYALESRQIMSSSGSVSDEDVSFWEGFAVSAGFQTKTQEGYRNAREVIYGDSDFTSNDVREWYTQLRGQLARRGMSVEEQDMTRRIAAEAWRVFGSDRPKAAKEIVNMLERDASSGDYSMFNSILREMGYRTEEDVWSMINELPESQVRQRLTTLMQEGNAE